MPLCRNRRLGLAILSWSALTSRRPAIDEGERDDHQQQRPEPPVMMQTPPLRRLLLLGRFGLRLRSHAVDAARNAPMQSSASALS